MTIDVFDEYGNYKFPDYSNSQYTYDVSTTGGVIMEMTIDKAQSNLRNIQRYYIKADNETIDFAIDILRKYQKITEIVENYGFDTSWLCLKKIGEVIDDGDANNKV